MKESTKNSSSAKQQKSYCRIPISAKYTIDKNGITLTDVQEAEIETRVFAEFLLAKFGIDFERTGN